MHKCNTCGTNPVDDSEEFCSTCIRAMDDALDGVFPSVPVSKPLGDIVCDADRLAAKPLRYRKRGTDGLIAYAVENGAAMSKLQVLCVDRFFRVREHQYRLIDSISVATYLIPDRMMEVV